MDVDNEILIAMVFSKPALWDKTNQFYGSRNVTDKCWKVISVKMKQDEKILRIRWRYMKDQFFAELGKIPPSRSGNDAIKVWPKWPYFKLLLFLQDVGKARAKQQNFTGRRSLLGPADAGAELESLSTFNFDNNLFSSPLPSCTESEDDSDQSKIFPAMSSFQNNIKKRKKSDNDKFLDTEQQKLKSLKIEKKSQQRRTEVENEHLLFFKSLLPHINKIPEHTLLSFRNCIQNTVEEFAYNNQSNSI